MRKISFFLVVLLFLAACEKDPVQLPSGPGTAVVDSVLLTRNDFDSLTVKYNSSSSSSSIYNYIGGYRDADCKTILLFNNFTSLHDADVDADSIVINDASIVLKEHDTWGQKDNFTFRTSLIPDSEHFEWTDTTDFDSYWESLSGHVIPLDFFSYTPDSLIISLDPATVKPWWKPEQGEYNNGIVLDYDESNPDGIIGYYSSNYNSITERPRLVINCTVYDTSETRDSSFTIYAARDFTYSDLRARENTPSFFVSQGAIRRAFITSSFLIPYLEEASVNYSELQLFVDQSASYFDEDSLTLYVGLFTSVNWDTENFKFSNYQNTGKVHIHDSKVSIPVSEVLMDLQDNAGTDVSGLFIRMSTELYGFSQIVFHPDSTRLKIVKTEF
jgi:hypothetical protein